MWRSTTIIQEATAVSFLLISFHRLVLELIEPLNSDRTSFLPSIRAIGTDIHDDIWTLLYFILIFFLLNYVNTNIFSVTNFRAWEMFLVVLVVYSAWISPFEFAFLPCKQNNALSIIDNIVNSFFGIDIILTFFVAYLDSQSYLLIDHPKRIAIRWDTKQLFFYFFFGYNNNLLDNYLNKLKSQLN